MISNVGVSSITASNAVVSWTTDIPSTSSVNYGMTTSLGNLVKAMQRTTQHSVTLAGLNSGMTYYFLVTSKDKSGSSSTSSIGSFATLGSAPIPSPSPSPISSGMWVPPQSVEWQWQLSTPVDLTVQASVYDIDGFDNDASVVSALHTQGRKTICYISVGSYEDWRLDANQFPSSVLGSNNGWPGEKWLDIRRIDVLGPIMAARFDMCKQKGFDSIEPDNVDGYTNNSVSECSTLLPFISAGKAVLNVEYKLQKDKFCPQANSMNFNSMLKNLSLDAFRDPCR